MAVDAARGADWLSAVVDDPRARKAAGWIAGVLTFYALLHRFEPAPYGVLVKGAVVGGLYSLIALGIALIYRANRIINFAAGDLGGAPAALSVLLLAVAGWPYPAAILVGLAAGILLGAVVELGIIRRFAKAPRLVLTVATIGIAQILTFLEIGMPSFFGASTPPQSFPSPFNFSFELGQVRFQGNDVLAMAMIPVVIAGLAWFLNRTHTGVAVRACAESADRASLLGVPVKRVNLTVWAVAALLSTIGVLLRAGVVGLPIGSALGVSVLMRTLAAAAIGRMTRMPTIIGASIALGIVEQSVVWHNGSSDVVDLVVFVVILAALLFQRGGLASRADDAALSSWTALREVRPTPPELARLREVQWVRRGLGIGVAVVALAVPAIVGDARVDLASFLCAYLIIALSLLVLAGWAGQISLGQFVFVGVGATAGAWMTLHWHMDILLVMLVAGVLGALSAIVIGIPALRIRGLFLAVATLASAFAATSYLLNSSHFGWIPDQFATVPRLPVFGRISLDSGPRYYYFSLAILVVCAVAVQGLRTSRTGRALIAVRENERGVQAYGINLTRAKLTAFAISGFFAAVAGVLIVAGQQALYPGISAPQSGINAFVMVVIGGLGSMVGVFAGGIYLESLGWFQGSVPAAVRPIFQIMGSGVGLLVILMFLPGGVGSLIYRGRDELLRRFANRRGIIVPSLIADSAAPRDELPVAADGGDPYPPEQRGPGLMPSSAVGD